MKQAILLAALSLCIFSACKKHTSVPSYIADDFKLDTTYKNLTAALGGTWVATETSQNKVDPYSSAVIFGNSSQVSFISFSGDTVTTSYKISLESNTYSVFDININSDNVVKKCKIVAISSDKLELQSVIGVTNQVTIDETFVRK